MDKNTAITVFEKAAELKASDVHIGVGFPVLFRINGELIPQTKQAITAEQAEGFAKSILGDHWKRFDETREADCSMGLSDGTRLRINCLFERGTVSIVARIVPNTIPTPEELGLVDLTQRFLTEKQGLVLFTGPTGAGKSTSLASILEAIRKQKALNVITLEDPIEFVFPTQQGIMRQREYGQDFHSFPEALKHVLRQDPEIVLVGEMRDAETIAAALTLAETGHLIFATLHTPNAIQTIDRIIDVFPPHQQSQIRSQLSLSLKAVVAQRLVPKVGGGRVAVREVLINTPAVGNIIRESRAQELMSVLQTGESVGMITFEKAAKKMLKDGLISQETYDLIVKIS